MTTRCSANREAPNALHQGVLAVIAARKYATLDDLLQIPSQKGQAPLFLILDGGTRPGRDLAPSSEQPKLLVFMVSSPTKGGGTYGDHSQNSSRGPWNTCQLSRS